MTGPGRSIIVTGSDSGYVPLLRDCIRSTAAGRKAKGVALGVLDCGLAPDEVDWCREQGASIVEPGWDVIFPASLDVAPSFRAMTARPWLRRYFPGFDTYLWLDADVWVQDWGAVDLFLAAAGLGDIAIVPEMHRSYTSFRETREDFETANGRAYALAFGNDVASRLIRRPLNNAGVFAMRAKSVAWDVWARVLEDGASRSATMVDQAALNVAIYDHGLREVRLPATANWISHLATPAWCPVRRALVEPDPPFEAIGIVHMTLGTKWDAPRPLQVAGEPGGTRMRSLRYDG